MFLSKLHDFHICNCIYNCILFLRVRYPTDGLYPGKVDAIDSLRHCYRVTFEKLPLGARSIPDYEVISVEPQETIPLSAYKTQHKASRNLFMSPARLLAQSALQVGGHLRLLIYANFNI